MSASTAPRATHRPWSPWPASRRSPSSAAPRSRWPGTWSTIEDIHGQNGIGGATIPDGPNGSRGPAVEALIEILSAAQPDSQTVVLLGPQTNLALALEQKPDIVRGIKEIVLMAGSLDPEGGNASRYAEFNVHVDPKAADKVLDVRSPDVLGAAGGRAAGERRPDVDRPAARHRPALLQRRRRHARVLS